MERRTIPGTSLEVSRAVLGTMTFGSQTDESAAADMLELAAERGVNFVDTANVYNGGKSEEIVGRLLRGRRHEFILASKVGIKAGDAADQQGLSPAAIRRGIEESLRRLDTEYLDLYYLHTPDYHTPLEETLATLDELVRSGKVRYLAASNYASWQVCRMLWLAQCNGWQPVRAAQPMYNLLARGLEQEFLPMARCFDLACFVYNPLAGGLLTGKHRLDADVAKGSRFDGNAIYRNRYWKEANFRAVGRLQQAAAQHGISLVTLAIGWLMNHTPVAGVVLGASRIDQLKENLAACEAGPLPAELVTACDDVWDELRGAGPPYNR